MSQTSSFVKSFDHALSLPIKIFSWFGMYSFIDKTRKQWTQCCLVILCVHFSFTQCIMSIIEARNDSLIEIADRVCVAGCCFLGYLKIVLIVLRRQDYHDLMRDLRSDKWLSGDKVMDPVYEEIVKEYVNIFNTINIVLLIVTASAFAGFVFSPCLIMAYQKIFHDEIDKYILPFDVWYPVDIGFYGKYFYESLMQGFIVWNFLAYEAFNLGIILHLYIHLECVEKSIHYIITEDDKINLENLSRNDEVFKKFSKIIYGRLRNIIMRYGEISKISDEFVDLVGPVLLVNFLVGSIFISCTGFIMTVVEDAHRKIKFFAIFLAMVTVNFDHCLFGQHLTNLSLAIPEAIYDSFWYLSDIKVQKSILFLMLRSQKPLKMTAMGYVDLDRVTFTNLASASWSYFILLRQLFD